ncbi:hypothetical protein FRC14_006878, partial [Serendipita sp. 396]
VPEDQSRHRAENAESTEEPDLVEATEESQAVTEEEIDHEKESEKEDEFIQRIADAYHWPS